jgi:hypothetical protein
LERQSKMATQVITTKVECFDDDDLIFYMEQDFENVVEVTFKQTCFNRDSLNDLCANLILAYNKLDLNNENKSE